MNAFSPEECSVKAIVDINFLGHDSSYLLIDSELHAIVVMKQKRVEGATDARSLACGRALQTWKRHRKLLNEAKILNDEVLKQRVMGIAVIRLSRIARLSPR